MKPTHIIIHHSTTRDSESFSWGAIRRYHTATLGWRDIGYHFGIELVGEYYEVLQGRLPNESGAHCVAEAMNNRALGICCVGDFDLEEPPDRQWQVCLNLVRYLTEQYRIPAGHVLGHGEVAADGRTCPGRNFDMKLFRALL